MPSVVVNKRRFPLKIQRFRIGVLAVMALVALRLALGCHFLYEGAWKIKHRDEFSAEPFLTLAKGPMAGFFYAMVPDIDGRQRLRIVTDADGRKSVDCEGIIARWDAIRQEFVDYYRPTGEAGEAARTAQEKLETQAKATFKRFQEQLKEYFQENLDDIVAHFGSLDRAQLEEYVPGRPERHQTAAFQQQRRWDRMMELRAEIGKWIKDVEAQEAAFKNTLYSLLDDQQTKRGHVPDNRWNPLRWSQMEQINFAVTYGLTAIGLCLMLGLCTPLAALGGACFMCFVVMTQPAWPGIYPPDPPVVGHALLVNKDFVEMVALLVVAATAAGRWGGLDYILYHWILKPLLSRRVKKEH